MKIVVVSTIRNESDIIETFVRYHCRIVDRMIIINHRSVDSSGSTLLKLQQEGLPIEILEESSLELQQGMFLTRCMKKAVTEYGADWILPLDADEFLAPDKSGSVREIFEKLPCDRVVKIPWRTYVPLSSDDTQELNVLKKIQHCRSNESQNLRKIMIPRSLALNRRGMIAAGNHGFVKKIFHKQKEFPSIQTNEVVLAHFPVRSVPQVMVKAFVGWLACLAKPNKQPTENFHLKQLYDRFKRGERLQPDELTAIALGYATKGGTGDKLQNPLTLKPIYRGAGDFDIRYADGAAINPLLILAQMAEEFAEALGSLQQPVGFE